VGIFRQHKKYYRDALNIAIRRLQYSYTVTDFLKNLPKIQEQSLTIYNIESAWRKSGLWPIDLDISIQYMKKFKMLELKTKLAGLDCETGTGP
jgi:hypothetical protein